MATVLPGQFREQLAHFGLYRTSAGGDESIVVRRKVGEPTDYMHINSRKLKIQRHNLALASQHYAHLSPSQKAATRHQIEEVEYQTSHGKTDTKLLLGRQLFIAKDIHQLNVAQRQIQPPLEACIILTDLALNPLEGELWLRYLKDAQWHDIPKEELSLGSWMFEKVPARQEAYQVYGESTGFLDPQRPEHQYMTEDDVRAYHYHRLMLTGEPYTLRFYSGWWDYNWYFRPPKNAAAFHIHSELNTFLFSGGLRIGLKRGVSPPPEDWLVPYHSHSVDAAVPDPKHYYDTFGGVYLIAGTSYIMTLQLINGTKIPWNGKLYYQFLG